MKKNSNKNEEGVKKVFGAKPPFRVIFNVKAIVALIIVLVFIVLTLIIIGIVLK